MGTSVPLCLAFACVLICGSALEVEFNGERELCVLLLLFL
jgi:hypothetical protein